MENPKAHNEIIPLKVSPGTTELISTEEIEKTRITSSSNIPEIEPVVKIGDSVFAVKGDISVVGGLPKAGKTAISVFILATAVQNIPVQTDTLSIRSVTTRKKVVYIDTEQSTAVTDNLRKSITKLLNSPDPPNLNIYNLRRFARAEEKRRYVMSMFHHFPDTGLWIIDGLADLVNNPNDITESFQIIGDFMAIAERQQTSIIFYLHENPGSLQKLRGNLGSEIERKCWGAITIRKNREKGFHWIESRMLRGSSDFENYYFTFDREIGRMRSLTDDERAQAENDVDKEAIKANKLRALAELATDHGKSCPLPYATLRSNIIQHHPGIYSRNIKNRAAEDKIKAMVTAEILKQDENKLYRLVKTEE
jgi:hypothetical protein